MKKASFSFLIITFVLLCTSYYSYSQIDMLFNEELNQITIPLTINNSSHVFLFDNACQASILFAEREEFSQYNIIGKSWLIDADGHKDTVYIAKEKIKITGLGIKSKIKLLLTKQPKILADLGISGIIGNDIIAQYNWLLDFKKKKIDTYRNIQGLTKEKLIKIADFRGKDGMLYSRLYLNQYADTFQIDLGFNQTLLSSKQPLNYQAEYIKVTYTESLTHKSIDTLSIFLADTLCFATNHAFSHVPIYVDSSAKSKLIGIDFLKQFETIYMDNASNSLWLTKKDVFQFTIPTAKCHKSNIMSCTYPKGQLSVRYHVGDAISVDKKSAIPNLMLLPSSYIKCRK